MKRYPEYKESGVAWIGEIPKHWIAKKLMYFCSIKSGNGFSHDLQGKTELEIPFFKVSDTNTPQNKVEMLYAQNTVSLQEVSDFKFILHKPNSIVFPKVGATLLLNKRNVLTQKSCIDNNMMSLYSNQSNHKFLYYAMLNVDFKRHYRAGGAVPSINESEIGNIPIAYPSLSEQRQIANFLDRKTEQIDELIRIKERRIALLQEQRTALINQVVTKGLDPNVEMKPSGGEWIGEIPVHWETIPIKHTLQTAKDSIRAGPFGSSLKSHEFQDKGIRVYNQQSVYNEDFSKSDIFISEEKFNELRSFIVQPKDVLITSRGTIGKMTIVPQNGEIGVLHPCLIRLRLNESKLIPKYLWWYVNHSSFFIESVKIASNSTTIEVIYTETLSSVKIPIPTVKEQLEIVEFLDVKIPMIDTTISNERKKIELLKEYRQSLISEAVTGKIDVRNEG